VAAPAWLRRLAGSAALRPSRRLVAAPLGPDPAFSHLAPAPGRRVDFTACRQLGTRTAITRLASATAATAAISRLATATATATGVAPRWLATAPGHPTVWLATTPRTLASGLAASGTTVSTTAGIRAAAA
jgi:hypothetical protein